MKKTVALILSCLLIAGMLSGCNQEDKPYEPTGKGLTWDEDYTGPLTQQEEEVSDQVLNLTYYPDHTMNPYTCTDYTNRALFTLLYQSLFAVDRNYAVTPQLCKQYAVSEDLKTYVFYPENATFSDGSALNAQDVLTSLETARDSDYYAGRFTQVKEMTLTDDGGVQITLTTDCENLPLLLDIPIVKASQVQLDRPVGTGPYYLDSQGATPVLRKNTNWWCKADMVVTASAIALSDAQSPASIRDEFQYEKLSLVCADPGSDSYADYRCDYELWDCENGLFLYLGCNVESPVFSLPGVRSALTFAIDRDTLVESYYRGFARSATLPASPLFPYYSDVLAEKYAYDGGEAFTKAVTDASVTGQTVVLLVNKDDSLRLRVARDIGEMLTAAGLVVQMSELSTSSYKKALQQKQYDLYLGQTKLSPNMDLTAFFSTKGAMNYGGMSDITLYNLCNQALANHGNYYSLHKAVMDDGRLCPVLFRSYAVYAERGLLTGLTPARDSVFYYSLGKTMEKALIKG
ncbi:MAG: ABC transporter substrate-binding protein [Oscillospiraceae bacterium]|nr:ABC transporter substrate-binding protein [Oscillospiraceae bacterium]